MQPIKQLSQALSTLAGNDNYLFTPSDLKSAVPAVSTPAFKVLLSRAVKTGLLSRVCRGLYLYEAVDYPRGLILFHAAARLRAEHFNYVSLETVLSEAGVISQIPINWITIMSSGRSNTIRCGNWGTIEFIHTRKQPDVIQEQLSYDARYHLWRASVALALQDMKDTKRDMDLIDREIADELV